MTLVRPLFGLRGLSLAMATFCGATALFILGLLVIGNGLAAYIALSGRPVDFNAPHLAVKVPVAKQTFCFEPPTGCRTVWSARSLGEEAPSIAGRAMALLPTAALAYGLAHACLCFIGLARGRYLASTTVRHLVRFAFGGLAFLILTPFADALGRWAAYTTFSLLLFLNGGKAFARFDGFDMTLPLLTNLLTPVYAVTLTIIALIMVRASRIAEDHAQIV